MTSILKVLVADDHVLIRDGLRHSLITLDKNIEVVEAKDGKEVLQMVEQCADISIILLDLYMPETDGFQLLINLCDRYPEIPIIVLSATEERSIMRKVLDFGAAGFIPKSTSQEVTLSAIKLVLSGGVYIPPDMLKTTHDQKVASHGISELELCGSAELEKGNESILNILTVRQRDVFSLLERGLQNKEIAKNLSLSEHTVKVHITAIFKALNVTSRIQAVLEVRKREL